MRAVELVTDRATCAPATAAAAQVTAAALRDGLLVLKAGVHDNVVRILTPLVIDDALLSQGLDILERAIHAASDEAQSAPFA
jgi:4-aminobutyrate aminotransferase/(S)-3-amino-2-methylpropionate transaminase